MRIKKPPPDQGEGRIYPRLYGLGFILLFIAISTEALRCSSLDLTLAPDQTEKKRMLVECEKRFSIVRFFHSEDCHGFFQELLKFRTLLSLTTFPILSVSGHLGFAHLGLQGGLLPRLQTLFGLDLAVHRVGVVVAGHACIIHLWRVCAMGKLEKL
jgi:hypothetical protein